MAETLDKGGSWGCSVWNLLVWDVVCGIIGGSEQGHRQQGARWSGAFSLVQSLRVEDFISMESSMQSTLSEE